MEARYNKRQKKLPLPKIPASAKKNIEKSQKNDSISEIFHLNKSKGKLEKSKLMLKIYNKANQSMIFDKDKESIALKAQQHVCNCI